MITEREYKTLKQEVEEAKADSERSQGALDQLMKQLEEDFECQDLKSAKSLLTELEQKRDKAQKEFEKQQKEYERKWHEKEI